MLRKSAGFATLGILIIVLLLALSGGVLVWQKVKTDSSTFIKSPSTSPSITSTPTLTVTHTPSPMSTITPTPEPTPIKEADSKTNALLLKGNLRVLRIGSRYFLEAQYPKFVSGEATVKSNEVIPLYHVPEFDTPKTNNLYTLDFDVDLEANYLVITYEHSDNRMNIGTIVMKREGIFFKIVKDLPLSYPLFNSMFPRVDNVENGKALIRLSDCIYCEPSIIKSIQLPLDNL